MGSTAAVAVAAMAIMRNALWFSSHSSCNTQICGKALDCGRHTCQLPCHQGDCPTCAMSVQVVCDCGRTVENVPCKAYRRSIYPKCPYLCEKPSTCHHARIQPHSCHPGPCPPCTLPCLQKLPCGHPCKAVCHDGEPCPPCHEKVEKECEGGHKKVSVLCCDREKPAFCDEVCGKLLACGKHVCRCAGWSEE